MAGIMIKREGSNYVVQAVPSGNNASVEGYTSGGPVTQAVAIDALLAHGWHQTDIGDAFYEADPDWLER
jgi:hypothetical protein